MARYFIKLAYDGTNFHGWQSQKNALGIQDELEKVLSHKLGHSIRLTGCGRTDTGVHARVFYAHFDIDNSHLTSGIKKLIQAINAFLPKDIVVFEMFQVNDHVHARFDATSRTYRYFIHQKKNPFLNAFSWHLYGSLDIEAIKNATQLLVGRHDFTSFSKLHSPTKTNFCSVSRAQWIIDDSLLIFEITADRFLRNMVRAITGTLIDVGKGKISVQEFKKIIDAKNRSLAGFSVPAHGLFLEKVEYPETIFKHESL